MNTIRHDAFGITAIPFIKNPEKPFLDEQRKNYLQQLHEFVQLRGFAAISGRVGCGKTAFVRYFAESLPRQRNKIIYLPFSSLCETDILKAVCERLDTEPPYARNDVINAIQTRIRELQPVNPIIVFDEMQNAANNVLNSIRLLANENFDSEDKISCILIGSNEFFERLRLAINQPLCQRITLFCQLRELTSDDTGNYIRHCLRSVGAEHQIFEPNTIQLIADISAGSIRLVKQLAGFAMVAASEAKSANVTLSHVRHAAQRCTLPIQELCR